MEIKNCPFKDITDLEYEGYIPESDNVKTTATLKHKSLLKV